MRELESIVNLVESRRETLVALADKVWGTPELCYAETRSAAAHAEALGELGFRVEKDIAGIPTALAAERGSDGPIIAILGEYDALPGLSQQAGVASRGRARPAASATAAATTCSAPARCWRPSR